MYEIFFVILNVFWGNENGDLFMVHLEYIIKYISTSKLKIIKILESSDFPSILCVAQEIKPG